MRLSSTTFQGTCRGLFAWADLSSNAYIAVGTEATGDTIVLGVVPRGIRIGLGQIQNTALGTSATLTLSFKTAAITLSSAISVSAAAQNAFANTLALGFGTITPSGITVANQFFDTEVIAVPPSYTGVGPDYDLLIATVAAGTVLTAGGQITGYLDYTTEV